MPLTAPMLLPRFKPSNFIEDTVFGVTANSVTCSHCGAVSTTKEKFSCLSVDIDVSKKSQRGGAICSLFDCFAKLCAEEVLQGSEAYFCETCKEKRTASKRNQVHKLPEVFIVHINRTAWQMHGKKEKLKHKVSFPLEDLDMRPFSAPEVQPADGYLYDLSALVCHHGNSVDTGHYTAFCKDAERNVWLLFDDEKVTVCSDTRPVLSAEAYLLLYTRKALPGRELL